jgi:hypothetical protein
MGSYVPHERFLDTTPTHLAESCPRCGGMGQEREYRSGVKPGGFLGFGGGLFSETRTRTCQRCDGTGTRRPEGT